MSFPPDTVAVGAVSGTLVSAPSPVSPSGSGAETRKSGESPVRPSDCDSGVDARVSAESPVRPSVCESLGGDSTTWTPWGSVVAEALWSRFISAP